MKYINENNKLRRILSILLVLAFALFTAACSGSEEESTSADAESAQEEAESTEEEADAESEEEEIITVKVASTGETNPFNYQDEDGNLTGYEVELLDLVAEKLGNVEFEFVITEWDGIFASLDSGKVDIIANNITWKEEREEKYLFSDVYYMKNHTVIVVAEGNPLGIETIDDLQGLNVETASGNATGMYLEEYNEEHEDNPINLIYSSNNTSQMLANIASGRYDAGLWAVSYVTVAEEELGIELDTISVDNEDEIQQSEAWLLYSQTDEGEELKALIDPVIQELKDDGTLSELSIKWFGEDYTE